MEYEEYIKQFEFWNNLSKQEKEKVYKNIVVKKYNKGSFIDNNNECLGVIKLMQGEIRTYIMSEEGREVTLFKIKENESCVLSASCILNQVKFDTFMIAEDDCILIAINSVFLNRLINENIYVKCYIYEMLSNRFSSVMNIFQEMLFDKFTVRLAKYLFNKYTKTNKYDIIITQEQIAKDMGSAREVVTRNLKVFADENILKITRGKISIIDLNKLKYFAENNI